MLLFPPARERTELDIENWRPAFISGCYDDDPKFMFETTNSLISIFFYSIYFIFFFIPLSLLHMTSLLLKFDTYLLFTSLCLHAQLIRFQ